MTNKFGHSFCKKFEYPADSPSDKGKKNRHQDNMSVCFIPHYTPLLYSKTGVYRGIYYFLILLYNIYCGYSLEPPQSSVPRLYILSKNMKIVKKI